MVHCRLVSCIWPGDGAKMSEAISLTVLVITFYIYGLLGLRIGCRVFRLDPPVPPPLPPDNEPVDDNAWFPFMIFEEYWDNE